MKINWIYLVLMTISYWVINTSILHAQGNSTFSGEVTYEMRHFSKPGAYSNDRQHSDSILLKPQYAYSWDNDRKVISLTGYFRYDDLDNDRTHTDIREASFVSAFEDWEIRLGISKVFWGVTESQHLVDVINQTDLIEGVDGEAKLGQPMVNLTYVSNLGNFDFFLLPYFRERTFAGSNGRFRGPLTVDTDHAIYAHNDEEKHQDFAIRWSHYYDSLEWGISYFQGTDREPLFVLPENGHQLTPYYVQTKQAGLELQNIIEDWLWKFEGIYKDTDTQSSYVATVAGFEYTFVNIYKGIDIGVLYEHIYDNRNTTIKTPFSNHSFLGSRFAFNDADSSELLAGLFYDNKHGDVNAFRVEASKRLSEYVSINIEMQSNVDTTHNSIAHYLNNDDYLQISLSLQW